ncbi:MAG TPA: hypothetical protein V6D31_04570 [Candidatus Sericytochromatia bacterium]
MPAPKKEWLKENPKLQANVPKKLYTALDDWRKGQKLSVTEGLCLVLQERFFPEQSPPTPPSVEARLTALEIKIAELKNGLVSPIVEESFMIDETSSELPEATLDNTLSETQESTLSEESPTLDQTSLIEIGNTISIKKLAARLNCTVPDIRDHHQTLPEWSAELDPENKSWKYRKPSSYIRVK